MEPQLTNFEEKKSYSFSILEFDKKGMFDIRSYTANTDDQENVIMVKFVVLQMYYDSRWELHEIDEVFEKYFDLINRAIEMYADEYGIENPKVIKTIDVETVRGMGAMRHTNS